VERNAKRKLFLAVATVAAGILSSAGSARAATGVLLSENFDSLQLGPFVSPTESNGTGQDWTDVPPSGWVRDNSSLPLGNPVEFQGFTFLNKASWIATEQNQNRADFTKGLNTVMVADPDAYDDGTSIEPSQFNPKITLPPIALSSVTPNTLVLKFNSSFRPYDAMTAKVDVSFDSGATFTNLLTYDRDNSGGDSALTRVDEDVTLNINNPGTGSALIQFSMSDAGNDWWWAVDNVQVTGDLVPEPASAALLGLGLAALAGRRKR
jgi:hypothetical protein